MNIFVSVVISALMVLGSMAYKSETAPLPLGASQSISSLTELTVLSHNDVLPITDTANTQTKKLKWGTATSSMKTILDAFYSPIFSTSAGLANLLSDETGTSGGFVRAGSPTITTPSITTPTLDVAGADATGDIYYNGGSGVLTRLGIGAGTSYYLRSSAGGIPEWSNSVLSTLITASTTFMASTTVDRDITVNGTSTFVGDVVGVNDNMFTASETLTAGNAVFIGDGSTELSVVKSTGHATNYSLTTTTWKSQSFTSTAGASSIKSITFFASDNSTSLTFTASIRADDGAGKPTGADIGGYTGTVVVNNSSPGAVETITFATPIPISPSTVYHVVWRSTGADGLMYGNNSGSTGANFSSDSGASWSASNGALELTIGEINSVSGQIGKTTAVATSTRSDNFLGFAVQNITSGQTGRVQTQGIVRGFSGLTPGAKYYLSDTYGGISSTQGTTRRFVGVAISATTLLIKHDNL